MKRHVLALLLITILAGFLRLNKLDQNPPSLYWDEASLAYNAFAILKEGIDEHGERLPIARFIAFGDYKPPGYIYTLVPFFAIFGVGDYSTRLPSAISGILMVWLTYLIVTKLFKENNAPPALLRLRDGTAIALFSALLLAISPWSIQLSRAAFEAHLAALFNLLGITFFLYADRKKWLLVISVIFFVLSFYTFNANRIIAPLIVLLLVVTQISQIVKNKTWVLISVITGVLLLLPTAGYFTTRESRLRFQEVSIFNNLDIIQKSNERIERSGNIWWAKIIHNRRVYYTKEYLKHFLDNFRGEYLFVKGDANPRLSTQDIGQLYIFELPFLVIGLLILISAILQKNSFASSSRLIIGWTLVALVPASVARETPHMLRTASILPAYQIITAFGLWTFWLWLQNKSRLLRITLLLLIITIALSQFIYYQHNYWVHYPKRWGHEWQFGYNELINKLQKYENDYDRIAVTSSLGRPYIYFLLYNQISPSQYFKNRIADRDWFGLWNVAGFGKFDFTSRPSEVSEKVLTVGTSGTFSGSGKLLDTVVSLEGKTVFEIGEK